MNLTTAQLTQIERICRAHFVAELHLIGSVLHDDFTPESDVDLLISYGDVPDGIYLENYFSLISDLEEFLKRKVDLVVDRPFRNPVFAKQIRTTKQLVYEKTTHPKMAV